MSQKHFLPTKEHYNNSHTTFISACIISYRSDLIKFVTGAGQFMRHTACCFPCQQRTVCSVIVLWPQGNKLGHTMQWMEKWKSLKMSLGRKKEKPYCFHGYSSAGVVLGATGASLPGLQITTVTKATSGWCMHLREQVFSNKSAKMIMSM